MKLEKLLENVEVVKWNCTSDFEIEGIKTHSTRSGKQRSFRVFGRYKR